MNHAITSTLWRYPPARVLFLCTGLLLAAARVPAAETQAGDASRGAVSWSQNCARCHEFRDPTEFRDDLWRPIVAHMRIRGGLTGRQQRDILAFLQASNNPEPVKAPAAAAVAPGGQGTLSGKEVYNQTCIACHGANGTGAIPGTPNFTAPDGPLAQSDEVLIRHITDGFQSPGSQMAMPPKGGNPQLNEADIRAVLGYLRESFGK